MLQVQWMVTDDNDNGYMMMIMMPFTFFMIWLQPIDITAAVDKSIDSHTTPSK